MPGCARQDIVREGEIAVYHTWSRCVQRAFLCGYDEATRTDFDYRREWIKKLLEYQASIFACDIGNYSILSNHQHLIIRTRPDIAATWSDEEVAWRWKMAWPAWTDGQWVRQPTDEEIEELLAEPHRIPILRKNLASLSWFHARWKEPIAKLANSEMNTSGHFYEARFGSRELCDEGSILCCSIYLDLNQIKAGMTTSLAESDCSAIQDRLKAWRQGEANKSVKKFHKRKDAEGDYELETSHVEQLLADCFLSPIDERGPLMSPAESHTSETSAVSTADTTDSASLRCSDEASERITAVETETESGADDVGDREEAATCTAENTADRRSPDTRSDVEVGTGKAGIGRRVSRKIHRRWQQRRRRRASDNVILSLPFPQYLQIAECTAAQLVADTLVADAPEHAPPSELELLLRQDDVAPANWRAAANNFAAWFHQAVGSNSNLKGILERLNRKWLQGIRHCRDVFT